VRSLVTESLRISDSAEYELQRLDLKDVRVYLQAARVSATLLSSFAQEVLDLFRVPLFMFFATELANSPQEELRLIKNKAQLYAAVTRQWMRREWWDDQAKQFKSGTRFVPLTLPALEKCVDFHSEALERIAYWMTDKGTAEIDEDCLRALVTEFVRELSSRQLRPVTLRPSGNGWCVTPGTLALASWAEDREARLSDFIDHLAKSLSETTLLQGR